MGREKRTSAPNSDPSGAASSPSRRRALATMLRGVGAAAASTVPASSIETPGPSPLLAAIAAHAEANAAANEAALAHSRAFDADDPAACDLLHIADAACERDDILLTALRALRPRDLDEAAALAEHYASLLANWEPNGMGEWLVAGLAAALSADSEGRTT